MSEIEDLPTCLCCRTPSTGSSDGRARLSIFARDGSGRQRMRAAGCNLRDVLRFCCAARIFSYVQGRCRASARPSLPSSSEKYGVCGRTCRLIWCSIARPRDHNHCDEVVLDHGFIRWRLVVCPDASVPDPTTAIRGPQGREDARFPWARRAGRQQTLG